MEQRFFMFKTQDEEKSLALKKTKRIIFLRSFGRLL